MTSETSNTAIYKGKNDKKPSQEPVLVFLRPRSGVTITASKKVFKTAIARNRARRLVKEAHRLAEKEIYGSDKGQIPNQATVPLSMNLKAGILTADFPALIQLIKKEIQKHV